MAMVSPSQLRPALIQSTSISRIGSDTEFADVVSESAIRSPSLALNEFYFFEKPVFSGGSAPVDRNAAEDPTHNPDSNFGRTPSGLDVNTPIVLQELALSRGGVVTHLRGDARLIRPHRSHLASHTNIQLHSTDADIAFDIRQQGYERSHGQAYRNRSPQF